MKYEGFFDKGKAEGRAAFDQLMFDCHFFLLPTRAECFGVSLVEASAYGLPPISTHTGGLPTVVDSGRTGELLPYDAEPSEWADRIAALWHDHPRYLAMAQAARHAYETEFNWTTWAQRILKIVDDLD
ncbi:MAG: glycosyltransferase family 4 protein [Planctomycetota bacterium]